ncbi:T9SS type A sorting domain-containing protein [Taibaiella soli]|uniref:PKD domain-containing protein n=1 Tax=Taibaiella soli TaxID=1649169 RepID=A0A2W2ASU5_9BACT|nr:T9SS type A sorting domain-containing protein [Taibaiella soli]PZF71024.1 hypothetical protein DN068_20185 [Taibaiella soli]
MKNLLLFLSALLLNAVLSSAQTIVRVTPLGGGTKDGSSWANAKSADSLQPILRRLGAGNEIWVAAGTYKPHHFSRDTSFAISNKLQVYGGFAGTETQRSQRNWNTNVTILSGDIGVPNDSTDNSFHVVTFDFNDSTTVLDGFTIRDGQADSNGNWHYTGGGIRLTSVSFVNPQISNCIIRNNFALKGGGGITAIAFGEVAMRLKNCYFTENSSAGSWGGGSILLYSLSTNAIQRPVIDSCTFFSNYATDTLQGAGAGICMISYEGTRANPVIKHCLFQANKARGGAAICVNSGYMNTSSVGAIYTTTTIDSCVFTQNSGTIAPAVFNISDKTTHASLRVLHSQIYNNSSYPNGVIFSSDDEAAGTYNVYEGCIFHDNSGYGALDLRPGNGTNDTTHITNCLFYNSLQSGIIGYSVGDGAHGHLYVNGVTAYVDSTRAQTITDGLVLNGASNSPGMPYGPCSSEAYISNSILWYDTPWWMVGLFALSVKTVQYGQSAVATTHVNNSIVRMVNNQWPNGTIGGQFDYGINGGGNKNADPKFRNYAQYDFRLRCGSPAIDSGSNALVPAGITTDLAGNARISNTTVDIGCFEADSLPAPIAMPTVTDTGLAAHCTASFNMTPDSVRWDFGDGQSSTAMNPVHTYTSPGIYQICLKIYTSCGSAQTCLADTIKQTSPTSVNNVNSIAAKLSIYPNPVQNTVHIDGLTDQTIARIYNLTGSLVMEQTLNAGENEINLAPLSSGMYVLKLSAANEAQQTFKLVKQ